MPSMSNCGKATYGHGIACLMRYPHFADVVAGLSSNLLEIVALQSCQSLTMLMELSTAMLMLMQMPMRRSGNESDNVARAGDYIFVIEIIVMHYCILTLQRSTSHEVCTQYLHVYIYIYILCIYYVYIHIYISYTHTCSLVYIHRYKSANAPNT